MGFPNFNQGPVSEIVESPDKATSDIAQEEPENGPGASSNPIMGPTMAATMEDALRRLRQRQFGQEPMPWMNEAREEAVEHSNDQESEAAEEAEADQLSAGYSNLNWEGAPEVAESPADETTSDVERGEPENAAEPLAVSSAASMSMATMSRDESMDEALRQLRLRRFSQEAAPWIGEAREEASEHLVAAANEAANEGAAAAVEAVAAEATTEETYVYTPPDAARSATAEPVASALPYSYPESEQPVAEEEVQTETISEKQRALADEAVEQTGRALERMANIAVGQLRQILGQVATAAAHQAGSVLEQLAEDAANQTRYALERLSLEATSHVRQELVKLTDKETTPPLSDAVVDLSGEVRRIGRELFKTTRATERNQDLFDSAISELQRLMARVEQVPAQLHGSESITEVKAALCREMIGLADALEASLVAAHETLERLQGLDESEEDETEEPAEISEDGISEDEVSEQGSEQAALRASEETPEQVAEEVREEGVESSSLPELQPSRRPAFWQVKLREWVDRIAPPTTPLPPPAAAEASRQEMADELQKRLDETLGAMDQWLEGQQLIYERLQIVMQNSGVRQIESEGQSFDPARHRAVSVEACDDVPNGTIIGEERKGYTLDGRILRYAEVVVAKNE